MKATSFQINRNLQLGSTKKVPGFSGYTNASGPAPSEFKLDYYNQIISDPRLTPSEIQDAINEVQYYVNEYQRQVNYHNGTGADTPHPGVNDAANAAVAQGWHDTAQEVINELKAKLPGGANAGSGGTNVNPPTGNPTTPSPDQSAFNWTPVFWIGGFLVVATIAGILIRSHVNKGKNKKLSSAAAA